MELKEIIQKAKENNCIVIEERKKEYHIICDFIEINDITFSNNIKLEIKEIKDTIYFGGFWIDKKDIQSVSFTGRRDYNIL